MPVTTGRITDYIKSTRDSLATVTDRDGLIKWAAHNFFLASEQFKSSSWATASATITENVAAAPNGTITADRANVTAAGAVYQTVNLTAGAKHKISMWVKSFGGTNQTFALFGDVNIGSANFTATDSWQLFEFEFTPAVGGAGRYHGIVVGSGNAAFDVLIWGAALYRSDLAMQPNTSAYPMYNPTTPKNLISFTEDFSQPVWWKSGITPTPNAAVSPNGMMNAYKLVESNTTSAHHVYWNAVLQTGSRTFSIYAKPAGRNYLYMADGYNGTLGAIVVDLITGNVVQNTAQRTVNVVPAPQGFYRISVINNTTSNFIFMFGPNNTASMLDSYNNTYTGDGVSGIYVWGAQVSDSASLDPYVPVYDAAVTSTAYHGPRLDYNPVTLACKGLLVEQARANLLTLSEQINGWSTSGVPTITANTVIAPSGLQTADTVAGDGGAFSGALRHSTSTSGAIYTSSVYIRSGTSPYVVILINQGNGGAWFNLSTGTKGAVSGTVASYDIVAVGNGWYRVWVSSAAGGTNHATLWIAPASADGANSGTGTVYVWGGQVELNSFPTSYIPTIGTTVTRNPDFATVSTQAFPYSTNECTFAIDVQRLFTTETGDEGAGVEFSTGAFQTNIIQLMYDYGSYNVVNARVFSSGASLVLAQQGGSSPNFVVGELPRKIGVALKSGNTVVAATGLLGATSSTTFTIPQATRLKISSNSDGAQGSDFVGWIRNITYIPRRLTNAELQTRTS